MRYREITENKLAFPDAKDFLADIDTSRGRIAEIARKNPWLIQDSQEATRRAFGETFSVFRAITSSGALRPDGVQSTTTNWNVAYGIMDSAPGVMFHRGDMIENTSYLLHYKITPADVLVWVPHAIRHVEAAIGKRTNHSIDGRDGDRVKLSAILAFLREQDEEEVVADLTGKTPKVLSWGNSMRELTKQRGLFVDFMRGTVKDKYDFLSDEQITEELQRYRDWLKFRA